MIFVFDILSSTQDLTSMIGSYGRDILQLIPPSMLKWEYEFCGQGHIRAVPVSAGDTEWESERVSFYIKQNNNIHFKREKSNGKRDFIEKLPTEAWADIIFVLK